MDPLSIAASTTSLVLFASEVSNLAKDLYFAVKQKPELLRRISDEIYQLQLVLLHVGQYCQGANSGSLAAVFGSCEGTLRAIQTRLTSLRALFSQGTLSRLLAFRKFKDEMKEIEELRKHLESSKVTLGIALQVRRMQVARKSTYLLRVLVPAC